MFRTQTFTKYVELDDYENGCDPDTATTYEVTIDFWDRTIDGLIKQIKEHFSVSDDHIILDACDEDGRIDIQIMEDYFGNAATQNDILFWKQNKRTLYLATYTTYVEKYEIIKIGDLL